MDFFQLLVGKSISNSRVSWHQVHGSGACGSYLENRMNDGDDDDDPCCASRIGN